MQNDVSLVRSLAEEVLHSYRNYVLPDYVYRTERGSVDDERQ